MKNWMIGLLLILCLFLSCLVIGFREDIQRLERDVSYCSDANKVSILLEYYDMYEEQFDSRFYEHELERMGTWRQGILPDYKIINVSISRE